MNTREGPRSPSAKVSNVDQYPLRRSAMMTLETSTSSLSFRFSELSQPI
jgi:subtilisin-like proprotein convertase family protein